jgi:molecular chaperone DnaK (HSP70)
MIRMRDKVYVKGQEKLGIGLVVGSTRVRDTMKEVRVYFKNLNVLESYAPDELVVIEDESN